MKVCYVNNELTVKDMDVIVICAGCKLIACVNKLKKGNVSCKTLYKELIKKIKNEDKERSNEKANNR